MTSILGTKDNPPLQANKTAGIKRTINNSPRKNSQEPETPYPQTFIPMTANLTIATLNVKGLNNTSKLTTTLNLLKSYAFTIITLQETNIKEKNIKYLQSLWPYDSIWTPNVAVLTTQKNISFYNITIPQQTINLHKL